MQLINLANKTAKKKNHLDLYCQLNELLFYDPFEKEQRARKKKKKQNNVDE